MKKHNLLLSNNRVIADVFQFFFLFNAVCFYVSVSGTNVDFLMT